MRTCLIVSALLAGAAMSTLTYAPVNAREPVTVTAPLTDEAVRARADALIARMTLEEKAGQLNMMFSLPQTASNIDGRVIAGKTGALLFVADPKEINRLQHLAMEQSRLKIPLLFGLDVIHGLTTIFPVPIANAASWDPDGVARSQAVAASEARAVGIHWTFAPMVDVARDPRWGRIVESAGEDPYLGSAMAAAQVRGFQGPYIGSPGHIIAGPKHFAGYGAAMGGRDYDEVDLSDSELWNVYLPPFKAAIDAGAGNIMSAYMGLNGVPASGNHWLLTDVLRKNWGFKGFVVSDSQAVQALVTHGLARDGDDAVARALNAGLDMEIALDGVAMDRLPAAVAAGRVASQQVDDAVRRVLEAKIRMGLFEHPYVDEKLAASTVADPAHLAAARVAGERAAVLLRNEAGLLPLDRTAVKSIAVIGPLADSPHDAAGPWVLDLNSPRVSSVLDGIRAQAGPGVRVDYAVGVTEPKRLIPRIFTNPGASGYHKPPPPADDATGIRQAVEAARAADIAVLVLGETHDMSGEMASRASLDLPGGQQALLDAVVATGKPVVVLLLKGRPLDLKDSKANAILDIWYPGSAAGAVAANLLFGDATPGGKLPFTWPRSAGQVPMIYSHLTSHYPANASERYWDQPGTPAWPFGYGLSYSSFAFSNLKIDRTEFSPGDTATVTVDLKNTGTRMADEVAQLYIHQRSGSAARPVRELKGFQRVTLKPGETRTLSFRLGEAELRYWSSAKYDWVIDDAVFDVGVGGDSTVPFGVTFEVKRK